MQVLPVLIQNLAAGVVGSEIDAALNQEILKLHLHKNRNQFNSMAGPLSKSKNNSSKYGEEGESVEEGLSSLEVGVTEPSRSHRSLRSIDSDFGFFGGDDGSEEESVAVEFITDTNQVPHTS